MQKTQEFEINDHYSISETEQEVSKDKTFLGISVLAIGDPHFKESNLEEASLYIIHIMKIIQTERPTIVVILGDFLHGHEKLHTKAVNKAYELVHKIRSVCPVYILVGNHDLINNKEFLTDNHWMNAMKEWKNVVIVDKGYIKSTNVGPFYFLPYVEPGRLEEALEQIEKNAGEEIKWKTARTIFCHQEFYGCNFGAVLSDKGDKWKPEYPLVISGHIHKKSKLENVFYPGASMKESFTEPENSSVAMCHFGETIRVESIQVGLPKKKSVYLPVEEAYTFEVPTTEDQYKLVLSGTTEEVNKFRKSKKYKNLSTKQIKIVFKHNSLELKKSDSLSSLQHYNFQTILYDMVKDKPDLVNLYNELVIIN